jgi:hypothetical protein
VHFLANANRSRYDSFSHEWEIDDLVAFLCTLTDGFDPNNPSAYNVPVQCQPKESVP